MLRTLMLSLAVFSVCVLADQADARGWRRGGCSGGSCGVSTGCYGGSCGVTTGGCYGGQCSVPAPAISVPADAPPAPMAKAAPTTPAEVAAAAPVERPVVESNNYNTTRRYARWRVGGRRFR